MALNRVVKLDTDTIPAGGYKDLKYSPEVDLTLKQIQAVEVTAGDYVNVFTSLYLGDNPIFRPDAALAILKFDHPNPLNFDLRHNKGVDLNFRVTNTATAARRVIFHLIYE
jgi:hypothetical protein